MVQRGGIVQLLFSNIYIYIYNVNSNSNDVHFPLNCPCVEFYLPNIIKVHRGTNCSIESDLLMNRLNEFTKLMFDTCSILWVRMIRLANHR